MSENTHIIQLIDQCSHEWRQLINFIAKKHKLTFSEWRVLIHVAEEKQLEQQCLAPALNIAPNNIINIVEALVKKGFIKKTIKPSDKKIRILQIAKKKDKTVKQLLKLNKQINQTWFSEFTPNKLTGFEKNLWQTLASIQAIQDKFI